MSELMQPGESGLPSRRSLMRSLAAAALPSKKPNVLLYITDDESWLERSVYGWSRLPTPNFDRVAREGVLFTHAYTSAPSCAPSRAALLTGRNFWELEQGAFIQAWLPARFPVLPDCFEAGGYHAGFTGKGWGPGMLTPSGRTRNPAGTAYQRLERKVVEEGINPIDYAANFADFLDRKPKDKPFWFWAGSTEPHDPHARENYRKLQRFGIAPDEVKTPPYLPQTAGARRGRENFAYELRYADEDLGRLLRILEERGELAHTLVIVTSDNGTAIPRAKTNLYDWGVRVPMAMMWPGRIRPGRRVDDFVNFIDFAPTMLEAAGLPVPPAVSGRSFLDVLLARGSGTVDRTRDWTAAGLEWHGEFDPVSFAGRMIRDRRYHYIVNYGARPSDLPDPARRSLTRPREELYDVQADPWERNNLAESPDHSAARDRLNARLEAYQRKTGDPRITGEMKIFEETRRYVQDRKRKGYPGN
ncbi:MAG: sulfatase [Bryobacterales bacterium]|nr:sulfatase [Bryobacterales bacterium]